MTDFQSINIFAKSFAELLVRKNCEIFCFFTLLYYCNYFHDELYYHIFLKLFSSLFQAWSQEGL